MSCLQNIMIDDLPVGIEIAEENTQRRINILIYSGTASLKNV